MDGALSAHTLGYGMLDRAHLTKHLLELAQRVGVEKVTMRGLAAEAGTSASSAYYHVAGKAELLDLLIEAVVNSIEVPTEGEWQDRVVALYTNAWRVLVTVRGIAGLLQQRPHTAAAANMDGATRSILRESGLPKRAFSAAYALLYVHLLGSVELEHNRAARATPGNPRAEATFRDGLQIILTGLRHTDEL
jgi:TetR/AcrR family transcriptional regulator, tetracycline repressor protein